MWQRYSAATLGDQAVFYHFYPPCTRARSDHNNTPSSNRRKPTRGFPAINLVRDVDQVSRFAGPQCRSPEQQHTSHDLLVCADRLTRSVSDLQTLPTWRSPHSFLAHTPNQTQEGRLRVAPPHCHQRAHHRHLRSLIVNRRGNGRWLRGVPIVNRLGRWQRNWHTHQRMMSFNRPWARMTRALVIVGSCTSPARLSPCSRVN